MSESTEAVTVLVERLRQTTSWLQITTEQQRHHMAVFLETAQALVDVLQTAFQKLQEKSDA